MADIWEHHSSSRQADLSGEFLVYVEVYISITASATLRRPRKKTDKRDSLNPSGSADDTKKLKEKSSWINLSRSQNGAGHWRPATCTLREEGKRGLLNIYVDDRFYQTVFVHLLKHTDIRHADSSLFFRKYCLSIYCAAEQRWSPSHTAEPIYLQFANTDACNAWLAMLRSYAIPEIYGKSLPSDPGSYRMWRQIELTLIQGRNLGYPKPLTESAVNPSVVGNSELYSEPELVDLDVSCEVHLNNILCGRTTIKKGIGSPDWHENFTFSELPPFETLEVIVWREKKLFKPTIMGSVRIALGNFRRGETVEGWFPVLQSGPVASDVQVGDIRMKLRVDEEIILPHSAYSSLLDKLNTRNFLDWITDFETKLHLKTVSTQLMSLAVAKNVLFEQVCELADREVDGTPSSHNTLFRGNTVLTKIMELSMSFYGREFLEASVGSVLRRLCAEKVAVEVDPLRSGKGLKDIERNVEQLIYWSREFWKQIYSVRTECPHEMRRLFEKVRTLVEQRYRIKGDIHDQNRELPWQSVSAFCFLRFIVPAILHPHLFGLCAGLPSVAVQRSLTLIAKVIQSLANLNATVQKEEFMRGVKDFLRESVPAMIDYILVVSTPTSDPHGHHTGFADNRHDRVNVINSLRQRTANMRPLDREAIPILPHLLDIPRHVAIIASAVIRNSRDFQARDDQSLEDLCNKCFEIEGQALRRVSLLSARLSSDRQLLPAGNSNEFHPYALAPTIPVTGNVCRRGSERRTANRWSRSSATPSSDMDSRHRPLISGGSTPSSPIYHAPPARLRQGSQMEISTGQLSSPPELPGGGTWSTRGNRHVHLKSTSTDATSLVAGNAADALPEPPTADEMTEDGAKAKKGLLRGILTRR